MLKRSLLSVAAVLVILQEWLWEVLDLAGQRLFRLLHLERFEAKLSKASRYQALFVLMVPLLLLVPINIVEFLLLINGAIVPSIPLEILSKLFCTMFVARIFDLVRPAVLSFAWFRWLYNSVIGILAWAHELIQTSAIYYPAIIMTKAIKRKTAIFLNRA